MPRPSAPLARLAGLVVTMALPLAGQAPRGETPAPLDLDAAITWALARAPQARGAAATARAAGASADAARGQWFPTLSFTPSLVRAQALAATAVPGAAPTVLPSERLTYGPAATLSYTLLDFGARHGAVAAAEATASASGATRDAVRQQLVATVEQQWATLQGARAVAVAQRASLASAVAARDAAVGRFQAGLATIADTLQGATAVAQARVAVVQADLAADDARIALATALGAAPDAVPAIADVAPPAPEVVAARTRESLDALATRGTVPDLVAARAQAASADAAVGAARAQRLPQLTVGASAADMRSTVPLLQGPTYSMSLGLALPLFDGGTRRANVEAAAAQAEAAHANADALRVQLENAQLQARALVAAAAEQATAAAGLLASATRNQAVALGRYQAGVGTLVDLLAAQSALAGARAGDAQARWQWVGALAAAARLSNLIDPATGRDPLVRRALPTP